MDAKKLRSINWWNEGAVVQPRVSVAPIIEEPVEPTAISVEDGFADNKLTQIGEPTTVNMPVQNNGTATPLVQPLIIVPYSSPMQPIYHYNPTMKQPEYVDDLDDLRVDDFDTYELTDAPKRVRDKKQKLTKDEKRTLKTDAIAAEKVKLGKKHIGAPIIIMIFTLILIAATAIGFLNVGGMGKYVSVYNVADDNISIAEPVVALVETFVDLGIETKYGDYYTDVKELGAYAKLPVYAVSAVTLLFLLCVIIMFIKALVAMFAKKRFNGTYHKYKFGCLSIVALLSALTVIVGGVYVSGGSIADITSFILPKEDVAFGAGYGLYAMVLVPIITFICSCCAYAKIKTTKTKANKKAKK